MHLDKFFGRRRPLPTLPILRRAQRRQFIEEQQWIIRKLIRDSYPDQEVCYTIFDMPKIIYDDTLEDILGVQQVIKEIIFNQRGNVYEFYIRNLPEGTFTRLRGEQDNIPEGPPQYDSDGTKIQTDEEFD